MLIAVTLASVSLSAQEQLTLKQAQDYAVQNAYSVQSAQLDLKKVEEQIKEFREFSAK